MSATNGFAGATPISGLLNYSIRKGYRRDVMVIDKPDASQQLPYPLP